MRVNAKLSDFINSKYHKETLDFLCGILLSDLREEIWCCSKIRAIPTPFSYFVSKGRMELYNFVRKDLGLVGDVVVEFEDFSIHVPKEIKIDDPIFAAENFYVFISVRRVWLPRKKPITLRYYEELTCYDSKFCCYYRFRKILLPKNKRDVYKFLTWLRLKKQILFPPGKKKWCKNYWKSGDYIALMPPDACIYGVAGIEIVEMGLGPEIMMEFLDWQHNRYKITK